MSHYRQWAAALALALCGCDQGEHILAWERSGEGGGPSTATEDTFAPWYGGPSYHAAWSRGLPSSVDSFPLGVWMQNPDNAARFAAIGINLYVGLWEGPTEEQLSTLATAGMTTVCDGAGVWTAHLQDDVVRAWLSPVGPDNAQELPDGSYGPCMEPSAVVAEYQRLQQVDASRPVWLSFGRGAAIVDWEGRGSCTGRTDMYPDYAAGGDVLGYWIYPVNQGNPLETVADGADNVLRWSNYTKPVIATIEASSFDGVTRPTPQQIRAEAWLALIHGVAGLEYYCHAWTPVETDIDCLEDLATAAALESQNREITALAPALNSPTITNGHAVTVDPPSARVDTMLKRQGGDTYLFAVAVGAEAVRATFSFERLPDAQSVEVLGEGRALDLIDGTISDDFEPYAVHLYRVLQ
jgi:hypothetical protein